MRNSAYKQKGSALVFVTLGLIAIAALGLFGYKFFLSKMAETSTYTDTTTTRETTITNDSNETPAPVSNSTDVEVMTKEVNDTTVPSVDQEFKDLNASASSL